MNSFGQEKRSAFEGWRILPRHPAATSLSLNEALRLASHLWAQARQTGRPTADSRDIDIDVILAAQVLSLRIPPDDAVIATTNAKHLAQFVTAKNWTEIG
ncbi:MAG: hypothetical protein U0Q16_24220 [Bryobacteraceae bacterium]